LRLQDRIRFVVGRLLLGILIERHIGIPGQSLISKIHYTSNGRPALKGDFDFNISHSEGLVVCAFGSNLKIGIDVECIKEIDIGELKSVLTPGELALIDENENPVKRFFRTWTMKECILKLKGENMDMLDSIETDLTVDGCYKNEIYLHELNIDKAYSCFLAVDQKDCTCTIQKVVY
jgi:4'-phosphopantetheinyl transferase